MDRDTFLNILHDAVSNRRFVALFVSMQTTSVNTDRHYFEVFCGFQNLQSYTTSFESEMLEQAIRNFDYVQEDDYKYIQAIAYYGKAIAYAYSNSFWEAYKWLDRLRDISTSLFTDHKEFIKELQTDAKHLMRDIIEYDRELNPISSIIRRLILWYI